MVGIIRRVLFHDLPLVGVMGGGRNTWHGRLFQCSFRRMDYLHKRRSGITVSYFGGLRGEGTTYDEGCLSSLLLDRELV